MNKILTAVFAMLALLLGVLAFFQHADLAVLRDKIATLESERDAARKNEKVAGDELENTRKQLADTKAFHERKQASSNAADASVLPAVASSGDGSKPGAAKPEKGIAGNFAEALNSEEGKEVFRSQAALQARMMYGGLAKDLNLDANTTSQVMALITERQSALTTASMEAMGKSGPELAATTEKLDAMGKQWDEKLKAVLGDSGMTQLKEYERTLGDRMFLSMSDSTFELAGAPLQKTEKDALIKLMAAERKNTPPSAMDGNGVREPGTAINTMKDDATAEKWLQNEADYQRRVLQGATKVLNPDQINALSESFKNMTNMQKLGRKMWKGNGAGAPAAPPANK